MWLIRKVGIELLGQLKRFCDFIHICGFEWGELHKKLSLSYVVGVKVVAGGHKAVEDHSQSNQEWEKQHLWGKHPVN